MTPAFFFSPPFDPYRILKVIHLRFAMLADVPYMLDDSSCVVAYFLFDYERHSLHLRLREVGVPQVVDCLGDFHVCDYYPCILGDTA